MDKFLGFMSKTRFYGICHHRLGKPFVVGVPTHFLLVSYHTDLNSRGFLNSISLQAKLNNGRLLPVLLLLASGSTVVQYKLDLR